jgi:hypothetical protein
LVISFNIPLVFPILIGVVVGLVTARLGSTIGRCRNQVVAVGVAVMAGTFAWSTEHVIDYVRFRVDSFNTITSEAPQATSQSINRFIDQWLQEETGQSSFIVFMLLKSKSSTIEISSHQYGIPLAGLKFTGTMLIFYWFVELLVVAGFAGYLNRSYSKEPFCEQCGTWRKREVPMLGSTTNLAEAAEALRRREIPAAVEALGAYQQGDFTRLEIEYCPVCFDDTHAKLVAVHDLREERKRWVERLVWTDYLDESSARKVLELAH